MSSLGLDRQGILSHQFYLQMCQTQYISELVQNRHISPHITTYFLNVWHKPPFISCNFMFKKTHQFMLIISVWNRGTVPSLHATWKRCHVALMLLSLVCWYYKMAIKYRERSGTAAMNKTVDGGMQKASSKHLVLWFVRSHEDVVQP